MEKVIGTGNEQESTGTVGSFRAVQHKRRRAYKKMLVAGKKEEN